MNVGQVAVIHIRLGEFISERQANPTQFQHAVGWEVGQLIANLVRVHAGQGEIEVISVDRSPAAFEHSQRGLDNLEICGLCAVGDLTQWEKKR